MSLFRAKEWWSVNLNESELYDSQCLVVSAIGNDRYQSILLGNHEGLLRVYYPRVTDGRNSTGYKPSDMLIEMQLTAPILQMGLGTLVSGCHDRQLAVLHPKLLTVYTLSRKETESAASDQVMLDTVYHHQLRHSAYSFVLGSFGGGRGRDFICVQSLDGLLSFYEQESFAFQLYLPDFLLPSPFAYLDKLDCFLFLNSSLILDCYSYENLASAAQTGNEARRKILRHWTYGIGEGILDVRAVAGDRCNIVILGERNLYNISDSGKTIFIKKLEFRPVACHSFVTPETKKLMVLVASDSYLLNIYEGTCLKWSMKIDQVPVFVGRIFLSDLYGGIVLLSENGYLQCIYLGTQPSVYLLPTIRQPEVNVSETEKELKRLEMEISKRDELDLADADVIGVCLTANNSPTQGEHGKMCRISLEISNQEPLDRIRVLFVVDQPLSTTVKSCTVSCRDRTTVESHVLLEKVGVVTNLNVKACVSYLNSSGVPYVIEREVKLPLTLVLCKTNPAKEAKYKLTVVTNKPVCPLNVIFQEFAEENDNPNVIGLKYENSDVAVTVLTAKTTQRYRLQSDCLESMGIVLSALVERVKLYFRNSPDFCLSYDSMLPLQTYFESLERYHNLLQQRHSAREKLSKRTSQYRTIQKKVLVNLKDITPKPISNLNNLLNDTYGMILSNINEIESIEHELELSRYSINAQSSMLITLMELMTIAATDLEYVRVIFSGNVYETDEQGWLEAQLAAASFFVRTVLAKSVKDQQKPTDIVLHPVTNVSKVMKAFSTVIDRVTKGTHLLERNEFENEKEPIATIPGAKEIPRDRATDVLPEGSKLSSLDLPVADNILAVVQKRKEKRLTKQERVDSLGTINASNAEEQSIEIVQRKEIFDGEKDAKESSSFDSTGGDAVWDSKGDEMVPNGSEGKRFVPVGRAVPLESAVGVHALKNKGGETAEAGF